MSSTDWAVTLDFATDAALTDNQLDELADIGDEQDLTVAARRGGGFVLLGTVPGDDPVPAAQELVGRGLAWAARVGLRATLVGAHVVTNEQAEADALAPSIPPLVGAAEAGALLSVSRQRIHQLSTQHPRFPAPVVRVALGPLWTEEAIRWFATVWDRKPGRPPASVHAS